MVARVGWSPGPAAWKDDLSPLTAAEWNYDRATHLLAHAGFGGTPAEIQKLADAGLERAVRSLVYYESIPNPTLQPFVESGLWDPTLNGFPESRPEATDRAEKSGTSMGVEIKPSGNRPEQPISDRFFYWLRATMLETRRLGYWWANRMLQTTHPVEQKMALLWHGHFATHENKVRDYRKMMQQIDLFERGATGNLRDLTIQVAQNPAMLYFLDAQYNVKGAPNENFAREVMELFTMGVGNYSEQDVRECARAFTGWYFANHIQQQPQHRRLEKVCQAAQAVLHETACLDTHGRSSFLSLSLGVVIGAARPSARNRAHTLNHLNTQNGAEPHHPSSSEGVRAQVGLRNCRIVTIVSGNRPPRAHEPILRSARHGTAPGCERRRRARARTAVHPRL